jgi:hypothetical protein
MDFDSLVPAPNTTKTEPRHFQWLRSVERDIQLRYAELHSLATTDPQRAGHGGEQTWVKLLTEWLPPAYQVRTRKYILPEGPGEPFETDIVVFRPSYPVPLREREEVIAGGVAAAFSVKLTLDAAGVRDGFDRAAKLRRSLMQRHGSPREQMLGAFTVGLLAHSHAWKKPSSSPIRNISDHCRRLDQEFCKHPRETLDFACVADLSTWTTIRYLSTRPGEVSGWPHASEDQQRDGCAISSIVVAEPSLSPTPVGTFITGLLVRLSYTDETIWPLAESLQLMGTLGSSKGRQRLWNLSDVYTDDIRAHLFDWNNAGSKDWHGMFVG